MVGRVWKSAVVALVILGSVCGMAPGSGVDEESQPDDAGPNSAFEPGWTWWQSAGEHRMCAGILDCEGALANPSLAKEEMTRTCTSLAFGPCPSAEAGAAFGWVSQLDSILLGSASYLSSGVAWVANASSDLGIGYQDTGLSDDLPYAYVMTGNTVGDADDTVYVGVASYLNTGNEPIETNVNEFYFARERDQLRTDRRSSGGSSTGAPEGPYLACISESQSGGVCGPPRVFPPEAYKFSVFSWHAGPLPEPVPNANTLQRQRMYPYAVIRTRLDVVGATLGDVVINSNDTLDTIGEADVTALTLQLVGQQSYRIEFPPTYTVGTVGNSTAGGGMMPIDEVRQVHVKVSRAQSGAAGGGGRDGVYVDYLFDTATFYDADKYVAYDPLVVQAPQPGCEANYPDLTLPSGKTWNSYTWGCRTGLSGTCYVDETHCTDEGMFWYPGSEGYCGAQALGTTCGCCSPINPNPPECEANYPDLVLPVGKTWNSYTWGCHTGLQGACYVDSTHCTDEGMHWYPGSDGYCGQQALSTTCGCCSPIAPDPTCEANHQDVTLPTDRSWESYTWTCRVQLGNGTHEGMCYADESYCTEDGYWWYGDGYCGSQALGTSCGCCSPVEPDRTCEGNNGDLVLPQDRTWDSYTWTCRANLQGSCYAEEKYCVEENGVPMYWYATGYCGTGGLATTCGCCSPVPPPVSPSPEPSPTPRPYDDPTADEAAYLAHWLTDSQVSFISSIKWLPHYIHEQSYIDYCIRLDFQTARTITQSTLDDIMRVTEDGIWFWQASLAGHPQWTVTDPVPVRVFGIAMTDVVTLADDVDTTGLPLYVNSNAKCPDDCSRFLRGKSSSRNFVPDYSACPDIRTDASPATMDHFDFNIWYSDYSFGAAGHGGDWGSRVDWNTFLWEVRNNDFQVSHHELGHVSGLPDAYGWPSTLDSTYSRPSSIMAWSSVLRRFDSVMTWRVWDLGYESFYAPVSGTRKSAPGGAETVRGVSRTETVAGGVQDAGATVDEEEDRRRLVFENR